MMFNVCCLLCALCLYRKLRLPLHDKKVIQIHLPDRGAHLYLARHQTSLIDRMAKLESA